MSLEIRYPDVYSVPVYSVFSLRWNAPTHFNRRILSKFPNVKKFKLSGYKISSLDSVEVFTKLTSLECFYTSISTLWPLYDVTTLKKIICEGSHIINLSGLENCTSLKKAVFDSGRLNTLLGLENAINLKYLSFSNNTINDTSILRNFQYLEELYCNVNSITNLGTSLSSRLRVLACSFNGISDLSVLENCPNLVTLECNGNLLRNLDVLRNCTNLEHLSCSNNRLENLDWLENCTELLELECCFNNLSNIDGLRNCTKLKKLECDHNLLTNIQILANHNDLTSLSCSYNRITSLQGIENCHYLLSIDCSNNQLLNIHPLIYLRRIRTVNDDDNLFTERTDLERRFYVALNTNPMVSNRSIYQQEQNVHSSAIQKSTRESVIRLLNDPNPPMEFDLSELNPKAATMIQKFCSDKTTHSELLITYSELFAYVWARIQESNSKLAMIKVLEQELLDSRGMCFTGKFTRLVNVLNGFYDDIEIKISDSEQIGAIIVQIIKSGVINVKETAIMALKELGYDQETIDTWTKDL